MADKTGIEWTDATWNPIRGCSRVSEGCRHCYAEGVAYRFSGPGQAYEGLVTIGADGERKRQWNGQIRFVEKHLLDPLKWKTGRRIFVNSMSDLFHVGVTDEELDRIFAVMALCPQHEFQVLTKRPARMATYLDPQDRGGRLRTARNRVWEIAFSNALKGVGNVNPEYIRRPDHRVWPLPNVRLGVSVEDQNAADYRLHYLCDLADLGWKTMVSFEPLLGSVDPGARWLALGSKTWAIVGGESGPIAAPIRPMHVRWVRDLYEDCVLAGVPFFFKQWGEWAISKAKCTPGVHTGGGIYLRPDGKLGNQGDWWAGRAVAMDRVGKKAAGDLLDGKRHHQFPEVQG